MKFKVILVVAIVCASCFSQSNRPDKPNEITRIESKADQEKNGCDFSAFKPFQVSHFVRSNLKVSFVPEYPQSAIQRNAHGIVSVKILVDREGSVVRACSLDGDEDLAKAAETAALKWRFKRKVVPGRESFVEAGITFRFVLEKTDLGVENSDETIVYARSIDSDTSKQ